MFLRLHLLLLKCSQGFKLQTSETHKSLLHLFPSLPPRRLPLAIQAPVSTLPQVFLWRRQLAAHQHLHDGPLHPHPVTPTMFPIIAPCLLFLFSVFPSWSSFYPHYLSIFHCHDDFSLTLEYAGIHIPLSSPPLTSLCSECHCCLPVRV